jgi:3-methyladenine DNA glycosylase AlkD
MHAATKFIRAALRERADPVRAPGMARYMKHQQPFLGVPAPGVREVARNAARRFSPPEFAEGERILRELWTGKYREERYAAIRLAERWRALRVPEALPLYEWMVETGQWWDLVDAIAANLIGPLIRDYPVLRPRIFAHIASPDLWLRRTALLAQLKLKGATDAKVLGELILKVAGEKEFFTRKAIGWALREYAKTDPAFVRDFVARHEQALPPLSRREALKNL